MKHHRILAAAILAGAAFSASAGRERDVVVGPEQACPAGYISSSLSYRWENGRFARDGRVCESLHGRN
jgi:hypothetical protein